MDTVVKFSHKTEIKFHSLKHKKFTNSTQQDIFFFVMQLIHGEKVL